MKMEITREVGAVWLFIRAELLLELPREGAQWKMHCNWLSWKDMKASCKVLKQM
jgi:hypothetical protein